MKKNIINSCIVFLIIIEIISLLFAYKALTSKSDFGYIEQKNMENGKLFALMLEQPNGLYKESVNKKWPSTGYKYNSSLSGCMDKNGNVVNGVLSYDENTRVTRVNTTETLQCYLYFDLRG
ncbi:MAG: hypothetical protein E7161_03165 [Firmicutes bacterium]|nr:hypothetical protein [Bacillota bacterium]